MRKPIPKSVRKQVYAKYNGHCAYCGCEIPEKGFNVDIYIALEIMNTQK